MASPPASSDRPPSTTFIRYFVVFMLMVMAVLLYLDRFCIAFAANYIRDDLGLTQNQLGLMFSAFFFSYALAQVPSGWLSDRYGARIMLTLYILAWSLFTFLTGIVYGLALLLVMRVACGLGQAGAYPTSASVISKWIPFSGRGGASSICALGGRMGGAIAPLLTASLIVMLVPIDTDGEGEHFLNDDILHGGGEFCGRLVPATATGITVPASTDPATDHIWLLLKSHLDTSTTQATIVTARSYQQLQIQRASQAQAGQPLTADPTSVQITETQRLALVAALNATLDQDDLFEDRAFSRLNKIPREAFSLLKKRQAGTDLTPPEQRRFHRLLIESTFAGSIKGLYVRGWRPVMYIYGVSGVLVGLFFWIIIRDRPEHHPWSNSAEHERIAEGRPADAPSPHGTPRGVPLMSLIRSRSMWCDCLMQTGGNVAWVFLVSWLAIYLMEIHEVEIQRRGFLVAAPMFVGMLGMLAGGRLTDALVPRIGLKWARRLPLVATKVSGAAAYACCVWFSTFPKESPFNSAESYTVLFCIVALSTDMGNPANWAFKQDVGGRYVGSVLGWGNMWGNFGATISPVIYAAVLGNHPVISDWNTLFLVCMGAFIFSGVCALGIDATIPIAPPDDEHSEGTSVEPASAA